MSRISLIAARLVFAGFWLVTAAYGVIAFVPFTYVEVIQFDVVPALNLFARLHPWLYWLALSAVAFTLREDLRRHETKRWVIGFLSVSVAAGVALVFRPVLATLRNDPSSLRLAFVSLVPLFWVAIIDLKGHAGRLLPSAPTATDDGRLFHACWLSATFLAAVYFGISLVRFAGQELRLAAVFSLASHLVISLGVYAAISLLRALALGFPARARAELIVVSVGAAAALAAVLQAVVLAAVSLSGRPAIAIAVATSIVASYLGLACRFAAAGADSTATGIDVFLGPLRPGRSAGRTFHVVALGAIALAAWALATATSIMDWNFLLQKLSALLVWILVFAAFHALGPLPRSRPRSAAFYLGVSALGLLAFKGLQVWDRGDKAASLDRYAGRDPSFKLARDLLRRPQGTSSRDDAAYYLYLQERTNIPRSVHIEPVDVRLAEAIPSPQGERPNVFIFVIDSLRRDYLSPYNPAVTFTPAIGEFARDSVVFTNAFTRYGGTGLSEPSIWVGGMIPHQQYITPFHPMNALEKLLSANGYRSLVSVDTILRTILEPDPAAVEIDKGVLDHDTKLHKSLADLAARLRRGEGGSGPVFAYCQPQDLHISTITREGASVPPGESYPGFYAPYASRLHRADAGFGAFLAALRELSLYDNSIIVLTSDHGDSLGEDGRWGHAYTIFPEIVRIPLIIHLPPSLAGRVVANPSGLSFLTDITPSLYSLLGDEPTLRNPIFGRSLFAKQRSELPAAARAGDTFLEVSSYGPVYGILGENGRSLYIADGVNYVEYLFDLTTYPAAPSAALSDAQRSSYRTLVRDSVDALYSFYRVPQGQRR